MNLQVITFAGLIGFLTATMGILVKVIGFPAQIKNNRERKSTEGLSTTLIVMTFMAYILWTVHGIIQKDWALIVGQGVGIITTGVIIWQIVSYKKK